VLGLLPPPSARLGASRWGPLRRRQALRAKRLGAIRRKKQKLWEITFRDGKRLRIADRVIEERVNDPSTHRYTPAYGAIH
jgi:hypothetical protein